VNCQIDRFPGGNFRWSTIDAQRIRAETNRLPWLAVLSDNRLPVSGRMFGSALSALDCVRRRMDSG